MAKITAGQVADAARKLLQVASAIDPKIALAAAGVEALSTIFGASGEVNTLLQAVYTETEANSKEVAQQVSEHYTERSDALKKSFEDHPGE